MIQYNGPWALTDNRAEEPVYDERDIDDPALGRRMDEVGVPGAVRLASDDVAVDPILGPRPGGSATVVRTRDRAPPPTGLASRCARQIGLTARNSSLYPSADRPRRSTGTGLVVARIAGKVQHAAAQAAQRLDTPEPGLCRVPLTRDDLEAGDDPDRDEAWCRLLSRFKTVLEVANRTTSARQDAPATVPTEPGHRPGTEQRSTT